MTSGGALLADHPLRTVPAGSADAEVRIDEFVRRSRELNGQIVAEREPWNQTATRDLIRHFAYGISDDNPLWLDGGYAQRAPLGGLVAPPSFLLSVRYPFLHGAPMAVPLFNLIAELEYRWREPIREHDSFSAWTRQTDVADSRDRLGRRTILISSAAEYRNQHGRLVGSASATTARRTPSDTSAIARGAPYAYSDTELDAIRDAILSEQRCGSRRPDLESLRAGDRLPPLVRGPLTIGDLICWLAAVGPVYRPAALGYRDHLAAPHRSMTHPTLRWPVHQSQQHEDFTLNAYRGMRAPFDHGAMRFAWASVLLTNWMGDGGFLQRLRIRLIDPIFYGDTTWYEAAITAIERREQSTVIRLRIAGRNQPGAMTTSGDAEVVFPDDPAARLGVRAPAAQAAVHTWTGPAARHDEPGQTGGSPTIALRAAAARAPGAVAVRCGGIALTYAELAGRVQAFGRRLGAAGIEPGAIVGHVMERSLDAIVGLLGILEAGAAFVPLDPGLPPDRVARLLEHARADALVTHRALLGRVALSHERMLCVDDGADAHRQPEQSPNGGENPERLACLLYTSGSTGHPKAVEITLDALALYLDALAATLPVTAADTYLHTAPLAFSAAVRQLFLPLSLGATVVIASDRQRRDPIELFELMRSHGVTVWDTVPTSWQVCIDALRAADPDRRAALLDHRVRLIACTGEALPWRTVDAWRALGHQAQLWNLYSQTETCGTVCAWHIQADERRASRFVPLGRPLPHTEVRVLDEALRPVADDTPGELWVAGARIARGYRGADAPEAERFVSPPGGGRLVRTGDRGVRRAGGWFEWLGRTDRQLKLRGMRVEPAEVEDVLCSHPRVRQAAVDARASRPDAPPRLVAELVVDGPVTALELRAFLRQRLPPHMVPHRFAFVDALPTTVSGKIARSAAAAPEPPSDPAPVARSQASGVQDLLSIWREVLESDSVGVDDDFFDAGGDSLLAVQLMVRVETAFARRLGVETLLAAPTVRQLAGVLTNGAGAPASSVTALQPAGARMPFFCIHGLTGDVLWYGELARRLAPDQPFYGVKARGLDDGEVPPSTVEDIARGYVADIRRVQPSGPYAVGGASFGGTVALEVAQQLRAQGEAVALLAIFDHVLVVQRRRRPPLGLRAWLRWAGNVPRWLRMFLALGGAHRRARVRRKLGLALRRLSRRSRAEAGDELSAADVLDYGGDLPEHRRRLVEVNMRALRRYRPQPYGGRVALFRARTRPLFGPRDPRDGWCELADRVDVIDLPTSHEGMFRAPHVGLLADALRRLL